MSTDTVKDDKFDVDKAYKYFSDEMGKMPLVFNMGGSKFRWDILKMAHSVSKPTSIDALLNNAERLIDFVNQPLKFTIKNEK